ncbi:transcriptional regulator, TetR family [Streptomyces sp. SolWspMP-sol7th]|nr:MULTISPECIES: helix-turn-helix domain-containing protein [unclassified Streptomyces]SCD69171.1 transcriptional regulator, TetR family [Streptomyces sp. SolWspMP-sol7th]
MPSTDPAGRRVYDASGRRAAARRTRAAVLGACRELLLTEGYRATTIRAVAARAEVSPEMVYKAYRGKAGLMKALWDTTLAGDDEPVPMSERAALRQVWAEPDAHEKLRGYAAFVCGVHQRTAALFSLLSEAGAEVAEVLAETERERLVGVTAFTGHLAERGLLRAGTDPARAADGVWALTGPHVYDRLTGARQWPASEYRQWLARTLAADLLP